MSPAAINPLMSFPLDTNQLPEILYLDELPETSLFTWNWSSLCQRALKEKVLLVTQNKFTYHSLLRALPKTKRKCRVRRRKHERGWVFQVTEADTDGPITTRTNKPAQKTNHGVFQKLAEQLIAGGQKPEGEVLEVEYRTAMIVRSLFYRKRNSTRPSAKVAIALRVRQSSGKYLPLKQVDKYEKKMISIFSFPSEGSGRDTS